MQKPFRLHIWHVKTIKATEKYSPPHTDKNYDILNAYVILDLIPVTSPKIVL